MNDHLINYETAKLAKDKGFNKHDDPSIVDSNIPNWQGCIFADKREEDHIAWWHGSCKEVLARPTQIQLRKWIHEFYNIEIEIVNWFFKEERIYSFGINNIADTRCFDSYEKSLEQALQEALKLV